MTTVRFLGATERDDEWRIPCHKRVRCEASGRARQSFGQTTCQRMTLGKPTDIRPETQLPCSFYSRIPLPRLNMSAEIHPKYYTACTAPTTTTPLVSQNLSDRIPAKGCRRLLVRSWANGTCGAIISDNGKITETNKSIQWGLVSKEEKRHSNQKMKGRTELDLVQDEVDGAKRSLEKVHFEAQAAQNKVIETAFRVDPGDGEDVPDHETVGGELGAQSVQ